MGYHDHVQLRLPLPLVGDLELRCAVQECHGVLEGEMAYRAVRKRATVEGVRAALGEMEAELDARGIGEEPWWSKPRSPAGTLRWSAPDASKRRARRTGVRGPRIGQPVA